MPNMSYCMYENTYNDLKDCVTRLDEDGLETVLKESNEEERFYVRAMYELCARYMEAYEVQIGEREVSPWG